MSMDKATALKTAANWWVEQIKAGTWDNGDVATEAVHNIFARKRPKLTADELVVVGNIIEKLHADDPSIEKTFGSCLYSDYGCHMLDDACHKAGLTKFSSVFDGPQKAGTRIMPVDGGYIVKAKNGYGAEWKELN